ncbi:MAG: phosphoenolpyruvate synthase regulatory protein [Burkholderiaceae bacterium]|nr:phosphoenolpyruvate synthase regulatory protein [Burkholderiaceae bacterium]
MPNQVNSSNARVVFIVSDGTGITAETLANSVLSQFVQTFDKIRLPFIDTADKARHAVRTINAVIGSGKPRPLVFSTLAKLEFSEIIQQANALHIDLIQTFISPLERELGQKSAQTIGLSHKSPDSQEYLHRIDAINYALAHDDGQSHRNLASADVILVGVSRSGKTPTSLYLAMQYGIKAANYPLIPEDFERGKLPPVLLEFKDKLFGLSIDPERLAKIRHERRPDSAYASLDNCRHEVREAEALMQKEDIRWLSTTTKSIEEIASSVMQQIRSA